MGNTLDNFSPQVDYNSASDASSVKACQQGDGFQFSLKTTYSILSN